MQIKLLNINEYEKLTDIINEQQQFHYNLNGPYSERFLRINATNFKEYMERKNIPLTYVAYESDTIIGFTSAYINSHNEAFIEDLFVNESYRCKNIGTELFTKLLDAINEYKCERIDLEVSIGNEKVLEFYKKFGFDITGYSLIKMNK